MKLSDLYQRLVESAIKESVGELQIGDDAKRIFTNIDGYSTAYKVRRLVGAKQRVLIVGDFRGRDTNFLEASGKDVITIDIANVKKFKRSICADVTSPLPIVSSYFDAVVMTEVLEHLLEDVEALKNLNVVLKDDGYLIVSVPYLHDEPEYHVRVHTKKSIIRLLEGSGYAITELIERGSLLSLGSRPIMYAIHLLNLGYYIASGRTFYNKILPWIARWDYSHNRRWRRILGTTKQPGVFIRAIKSPPKDFTAININEFSIT